MIKILSIPGILGLKPIAPNPARSFPGNVTKSNVIPDKGDDGVGLSFLSHHTKRGAVGSPNTI